MIASSKLLIAHGSRKIRCIAESSDGHNPGHDTASAE
jgi:hypothetical protein